MSVTVQVEKQSKTGQVKLSFLVELAPEGDPERKRDFGILRRLTDAAAPDNPRIQEELRTELGAALFTVIEDQP